MSTQHAPEQWAQRILARVEKQRDSLLQAVQLLMESAPPRMTYRNAKERAAYVKLRAAIAKVTDMPATITVKARPYCTFCGGDFGKHQPNCIKTTGGAA